MSRIFDALQRSESERSGVDLSVLSAATEVLQRAELRAVSEQKAATQIERSDEMQSAERETLLQPGVAPDAVAVETHEAASHSLNEKCSDVFGQFKSLQV